MDLNHRTEALLRRLVRKDAGIAVRKLLARTRPEDLAAAMEHLTWAEQRRLLGHIEDRDYAATLIANLRDEQARKLLSLQDERYVYDIIDRMDPDDATDVVEGLPQDLRDHVVGRLEDDHDEVPDLLEWPSDTAGGIMSPSMLLMPETATCSRVIEEIQERGEELESIYYVYCVDESERLTGVTSLRSLLVHPPHTPLTALMSREVINVEPQTDQEEVARFVARYDLLAIPVVGPDRRVLGIVTVDDVVDVIRDEAAEDMMLMAGVSDEPIGNAPHQALHRAGWLTATLLGGVLMAEIIGYYEHTLASVAVLAGFIPVVMGMGGNVGIQSATVAVRGLATGRIQLGGALRFIWTEIQIGVILGLFFATMLGLYGGGRFGLWIGLSVAVSISIAVASAAAIGATIPVVLSRSGADPAIATGPFVTTAVDIFSILVYFNASKLLLGL